MPDALRRGSVVVRGRSYAVVWAIAGTSVTVLPIVAAGASRHRAELELPIEEELALGLPLGRAVRVASRRNEQLADLELLGELPGEVMCRVVQAMVRLEVARSTETRWEADRAHRAHQHDMTERPVNLVA
jgi:hypothetical protein